jgi:hypothetical protein
VLAGDEMGGGQGARVELLWQELLDEQEIRILFLLTSMHKSIKK